MNPSRTLILLIDKLKEMDIKITNASLTVLLLYSIPESYENFRIAIESRNKLKTPEMMKTKLLEDANARKNKEVSTIPDSQRALYWKEKENSSCHGIKHFKPIWEMHI
ncbi:uncharacterized protein CEXT_160631 [Caerostris extrusa]|uniref:Retrovirus-related Pol polyprotein from transposon TNT 1-94 n=1 Tax=Caerostris extrusa TaxID=172846 RepID=A0AAV4YEP0_CAEEX|nr:uncharacterized protein CEXT_160631 [Caerostris extrusa]